MSPALKPDAAHQRECHTAALRATMPVPFAGAPSAEPPTNSLVGIDLFAGAGGLSLGARSAGIDVRIAVDVNHWASKTYSYNHPHTLTLQSDVRSLHSIHLPIPKPPLIVFGGPPCQGFSTSNQRTRTPKNPNNWMFEHFVKVVKQLMPQWILFENVAGITHTAEGLFLSTIEKRFKRIGYQLAVGLLNSADFGVPQRRTRFFLVGRLDGDPPDLPVPARSVGHISVQDAIGDLPSLSNGADIDELPYRGPPASDYAQTMRSIMGASSTNHLVSRNAPSIVKRYRHIPPGGNWEDIPAALMKSYADRTRCHTGIYRRLDPHQPAVVIGNFRKNMLIHPYEDRGLSVREAARLQSFPDSYRFFGSIGLQQQQVGNAVPPLLARAVFNQIIHAHTGRPIAVGAF